MGVSPRTGAKRCRYVVNDINEAVAKEAAAVIQTSASMLSRVPADISDETEAAAVVKTAEKELARSIQRSGMAGYDNEVSRIRLQ